MEFFLKIWRTSFIRGAKFEEFLSPICFVSLTLDLFLFLFELMLVMNMFFMDLRVVME